MSNTTKLLERVLSGGCNMGWISDAEAEEIRALAAPVASAAPSGELPACALIYSGARYWSEEQMQAAIAHQPPKEALTDSVILDMARNFGGLWTAADDDWLIGFARAISAATAPNKQLVEALEMTLPLAERLVRNFGDDPSKDVEFIKARAALAAAGESTS